MFLSGKIVKGAIFLFVVSIFWGHIAFALTLDKKVFPSDFDIRAIKYDNVKGILYAGGKHGLYEISDEGTRETGLPVGIKEVMDICVTRDLLYIISEKGVYCKKLNESSGKWEKSFIDNMVTSAAVHDYRRNEVVFWNKKKIYIVTPEEVSTIKVLTGESEIIKIRYGEKDLFLLTDKSVMSMAKKTGLWTKLINFDRSNADSETGNDTQIENNTYVNGVQGYMPDISISAGKVLVSSLSGLYLYDIKSGNYKKLKTTGIPLSGIKGITFSGNIPVIISGNKLFALENVDAPAEMIFSSAGCEDIQVISDSTNDGNQFVWVGGGNILYKINIFEKPDESKMGVTGAKGHISIGQVHRMAVRYAEVDPEKINKWRRAARIKAILPKVSFNLSESDDENVEIYKSASKYYIVNGPREVERDWKIGFSWDLSDLIWNAAQTSIDVRSKLMVQLRNDILEEVTRLYFERMKLEREIQNISEIPGKTGEVEKKKMRLAEVTAYIDAYTGGAFSKNILKENKDL